MRRFIALILLLVIPLQFAWAAVLDVHGHVGNTTSHAGQLHGHHHDHHHDVVDAGDADHGDPLPADDEHHVSHFHPVFSFILTHIALPTGYAAPEGPIPHLAVTRVSHTSPPLERPPRAFA